MAESIVIHMQLFLPELVWNGYSHLASSLVDANFHRSRLAARIARLVLVPPRYSCANGNTFSNIQQLPKDSHSAQISLPLQPSILDGQYAAKEI
jgi:hypothetical protein